MTIEPSNQTNQRDSGDNVQIGVGSYIGNISDTNGPVNVIGKLTQIFNNLKLPMKRNYVIASIGSIICLFSFFALPFFDIGLTHIYGLIIPGWKKTRIVNSA
jgi:hypothetical protein